MFHRTVFCSLQFSAFHRWPEAPEEVSFLRNKHRHLFKVVASAEVKHNDRDIEFISMKGRLEQYCRRHFADYDLCSTSCEQIAQILLEAFPDLCSVSVSEDGENGVVLRRLDIAGEV